MKSNELRPGDKIVFDATSYVFTKCEPFGQYWRVHLGDKIITCTRNWEWQIETRFKKRKRKYGNKAK